MANEHFRKKKKQKQKKEKKNKILDVLLVCKMFSLNPEQEF